MTKSLRFRLFLSYLAVTAIILLAAGLTLGLVWRGAQERIMRARLNETLPLAARLVRTNLRQGVPPESIAKKINREILPRQFRLLLVQRGVSSATLPTMRWWGKHCPPACPKS